MEKPVEIIGVCLEELRKIAKNIGLGGQSTDLNLNC
jgi:hypothetical protein